MPKDGRKIRALELGSGRGSLTRHLATQLREINRLEVMVATNLSERENAHHIE